MNKFAKISDTGEILYTAMFSSIEHHPVNDPSMVEVPIPFELNDSLYFDATDQTIKDRGPRPPNHKWSGGQWVYDIERGIETAKEEVLLRLATTDYLMIDYPLKNRDEWLAYRAALRALNTNDPQNIVWPVKPDIIKST